MHSPATVFFYQTKTYIATTSLLFLQAGFLVVAGASAFVLAAGDVEFVGHSQADGAVKVVAILGDIGADAVGSPSFLARLENVVGIEVDQQRLVEEGFVDTRPNRPIVLDALKLVIGITCDTHAQYCCPGMRKDKGVPQFKPPQRPVMGQS